MNSRKRNKAPEQPELAAVMLKHPLFDPLDEAQKGQLSGFVEIVSFSRGDVLIQEGELQQRLHFILTGKVCVTRLDPDSKDEVILTSVGRGALVGENAAMLARHAIASVVAESDGTSACLDISRLRDSADTASLMLALLDGTAQELATKLEEAGTRSISYYRWQLTQLQEKRAAGSFTLRTMVLLGLYSLVSSALTSPDQPLPTRVFVTGSLILMCALATGWYMKDNRLKAADFGVSWQNWRQHAFEALKLSLPVMVGVVILKGWVLTLRGEPDQALFQPGLAFEHFSWPLFAAVLMATVILSLAQEFVVRSGIQGSLQIFYSEDRFSFPWQPIVVSNLLFAATYAHLSPLWAAA
ncbi:MAG: cyclic nucleotide-binding domain-containing protein, partial [Candidatus Sericytochromatia bacterium]